MALNTHQHMFFFQLVDKLTTDEDIQDVEFDLNDVSDWFSTKYLIHIYFIIKQHYLNLLYFC